MKASPIQLLETVLERVHVESVESYESTDSEDLEDVVLQTFKRFEAFPDFWDGDRRPPVAGMEDRTFRIELGVRTPTEQSANGPYKFEVLFSAVVACVPEKVHELTAAQAAQEYGLTMLFGMIREQLLNVTARMEHGMRLLPSVSFMGDSKQEVQKPGAVEGKQPARVRHAASARLTES